MKNLLVVQLGLLSFALFIQACAPAQEEYTDGISLNPYSTGLSSDVAVTQEFPPNGSNNVPTNAQLSILFDGGRISGAANNFTTDKVYLYNMTDKAIVPMQVSIRSDLMGFDLKPMTGDHVSNLEPSTDYKLGTKFMLDENGNYIPKFFAEFRTEDYSKGSGFRVVGVYPGGGNKQSQRIKTNAAIEIQMSDRIKPNGPICSESPLTGNSEIDSAIIALRQSVIVSSGTLFQGLGYEQLPTLNCIHCPDGVCNRIRILPRNGSRRWPFASWLNITIRTTGQGVSSDLRGSTQGAMSETFNLKDKGGIFVGL